MRPEPSEQSRNQARDVQGSLFDSGFHGTRLPRRPAPGDRRDKGASEEPSRSFVHSSAQPLLDFDRPPDPQPAKAEPPPAPPEKAPHQVVAPAPPPANQATGEVAKAKDILEAVRVLKRIELESRAPDQDERQALERFGGFGAVALRLFPDPATGQYKSASWYELGRELTGLLTTAEYESARRTVFNAFYTSPTVVSAMFGALERLGVPGNATVLEPGCGAGNFLRAPEAKHYRFIGVELDSLSGRIARALFPEHDIRIESFRDTKLPEGSIDAVIGNPPFADVKLEHHGKRFSLHDFFIAKSLDALRPGGILAAVTSHFTLDKQNAAVREHIATLADFLGAIRLPSDAFAREGTKVVTDIVFFRRRGEREPERHAEHEWLQVSPLFVNGM